MDELSQRKSFFLFGPRSTGKTTLLREQFSESAIITLLRRAEHLPLAEKPSTFGDRVREILRKHRVVIIDEIQTLPALLDEVHHRIEAEGVTFILTGSSGRKLKRGGVNLLAGRAWQAELFPLVSEEIPSFDIDRYLRFGGLPQVYGAEYPEEELDAYVTTYLKEEIREEALVQNLTHFSRFLKVAALEVDFVIGSSCALEVTATTRVADKHCKGLRPFRDESPECELILVSFDENDRTTEDGIRLLHWCNFARELWNASLIRS